MPAKRLQGAESTMPRSPPGATHLSSYSIDQIAYLYDPKSVASSRFRDPLRTETTLAFSKTGAYIVHSVRTLFAKEVAKEDVMKSNEAEILRATRLALVLTTDEAGRLVGVTRRAWEHWEAGSRKVPTAAYELFLAKAEGLVPSHLQDHGRNVCVILSDDGNSHIDVVGSDNFLSWKYGKTQCTVVVDSWAYHPLHRLRYRHSTEASVRANPRLVDRLEAWKGEDKDTEG